MDETKIVKASNECKSVKDPIYLPYNWPQKTDAACYWCCHKFDTMPLFLPVKYDSKRDTFEIYGNFCSWSCMKAFNINSKSASAYRRCTIIQLLHKRLYGMTQKIPCAENRYKLKLFGGNMTIDEFRERGYVPDKTVMFRPHVVEITTL